MAHKCWLCDSNEKPLLKLSNGEWECDECAEFDRNVDLDQYEEDRRRRIAEENEY